MPLSPPSGNEERTFLSLTANRQWYTAKRWWQRKSGAKKNTSMIIKSPTPTSLSPQNWGPVSVQFLLTTYSHIPSRSRLNSARQNENQFKNQLLLLSLIRLLPISNEIHGSVPKLTKPKPQLDNNRRSCSFQRKFPRKFVLSREHFFSRKTEMTRIIFYCRAIIIVFGAGKAVLGDAQFERKRTI